MKMIKYILVTVVLATGLTAGAQTHDTKQPVQKQNSGMHKVKTNEKAKAMPDAKAKGDQIKPSGEAIQDDKNSKKAATPAETTDKEKANTTPAKKQDVQKVNSKTGDENKEKMKEIKRPVKKVEGAKKANG